MHAHGMAISATQSRIALALRASVMVLPACLLSGIAGGCKSSTRVVERSGEAVVRGSEEARSLLGTVDPTGVLFETAARQRTWEDLRAKVDAIDVDAWNTAVRRMIDLNDFFRSKLDEVDVTQWRALREEWSALAQATRLQVEAANLQQTSEALASLAQTTEQRLAAADISKAGEAITQLEHAAEQVNRQVEEVSQDVQRILSAVATEELAETLSRMRSTAGALESSASRVPETLNSLELAARSVTRTMNIAAGVLMVVGLVAIGALIGSFFRRRA